MSDQDSERRVYPRFAAPRGTIVAWHRFNERRFRQWTTSAWADCSSVHPIRRLLEPTFSCLLMRLQVRYALVPLSNEVAPTKVWA